ncbi:hypothetical protein DMB42_39855 [Nonomuraea sp. WAC 01424]|uniref:hypothetical protein n=1 Tax=Nonomuraea sp. WAC 01424 TaxID=2203200 RepID=UPI000F775632|nr:hypothetical protein [Nonomuraea sp. WAC 01424]RSN01148.1 hypothetical protein DMB42_39855 [Nonomuraea sp. WAC 01424]
MIRLFEGFDKYNLQARIYPALITFLPVMASVFLLWSKTFPQQTVAAFVTAGGAFLVANVVRGLGKSLEKRLVVRWDGLPTTHMLRYRNNSNIPLLKRRREALQKITHLRFPAESKERLDPQRADQIYIAATRVLIIHVRDKKGRYDLVHDENINYGFRRNLLALKPLGIAVALLCVISDAAWWQLNKVAAYPLIISVLLNAALLAAWILLIRPQWVWQAGEAYAERLFDTLEDPTLLPGDSEPSETQT